MSQSVTVYVSTLDRWSAVWPGFCHGLGKYWPDCPWPVVFSTEMLDAPCGISLKVGPEEHWARRNRKALMKLKTPVVLFMIEDFWLCALVDTVAMLDFAAVVGRGEADYIALDFGRLGQSDGDFVPDDRLFYRSEDDFYRLALQPTFWRKEVLLDLLRDDITTPWAFEQAGQERSQEQELICLATKDRWFLKYVAYSAPGFDGGVVERGKWTLSAKLYAEREGLSVDFLTNPDGTRCEL